MCPYIQWLSLQCYPFIAAYFYLISSTIHAQSSRVVFDFEDIALILQNNVAFLESKSSFDVQAPLSTFCCFSSISTSTASTAASRLIRSFVDLASAVCFKGQYS